LPDCGCLVAIVAVVRWLRCSARIHTVYALLRAARLFGCAPPQLPRAFRYTATLPRVLVLARWTFTFGLAVARCGLPVARLLRCCCYRQFPLSVLFGLVYGLFCYVHCGLPDSAWLLLVYGLPQFGTLPFLLLFVVVGFSTRFSSATVPRTRCFPGLPRLPRSYGCCLTWVLRAFTARRTYLRTRFLAVYGLPFYATPPRLVGSFAVRHTVTLRFALRFIRRTVAVQLPLVHTCPHAGSHLPGSVVPGCLLRGSLHAHVPRRFACFTVHRYATRVDTAYAFWHLPFTFWFATTVRFGCLCRTRRFIRLLPAPYAVTWFTVLWLVIPRFILGSLRAGYRATHCAGFVAFPFLHTYAVARAIHGYALYRPLVDVVLCRSTGLQHARLRIATVPVAWLVLPATYCGSACPHTTLPRVLVVRWIAVPVQFGLRVATPPGLQFGFHLHMPLRSSCRLRGLVSPHHTGCGYACADSCPAFRLVAVVPLLPDCRLVWLPPRRVYRLYHTCTVYLTFTLIALRCLAVACRALVAVRSRFVLR